MDTDHVEILDLRGLEPPYPMLAILRHLTTAPPRVFEVLLPHYPILLLPELETHGWACEVVSHDAELCRCRLVPPEAAR